MAGFLGGVRDQQLRRDYNTDEPDGSNHSFIIYEKAEPFAIHGVYIPRSE
jgi:hypothetical protein